MTTTCIRDVKKIVCLLDSLPTVSHEHEQSAQVHEAATDWSVGGGNLGKRTRPKNRSRLLQTVGEVQGNGRSLPSSRAFRPLLFHTNSIQSCLFVIFQGLFKPNYLIHFLLIAQIVVYEALGYWIISTYGTGWLPFLAAAFFVGASWVRLTSLSLLVKICPCLCWERMSEWRGLCFRRMRVTRCTIIHTEQLPTTPTWTTSSNSLSSAFNQDSARTSGPNITVVITPNQTWSVWWTPCTLHVIPRFPGLVALRNTVTKILNTLRFTPA